MKIPNSFFEDEVRDGFYVSAMMKRAWAAQMVILEDIDILCRKHGIRYYAEYGTLLGTIRHGGFIPWDDDMDICMLRKDYEKFCEIAPKELPDIYGFLNFANSDENEYNCIDYLTRVYTGNRIRVDRAYMEKFYGFPYVSGIDIFPLDYLPSDEKACKGIYDCVATIDALAQTIYSLNKDEQEEALLGVEEVFHVKIDRSGYLSKQLYLLADKMSGMCRENEADFVTSIILWTQNENRKFPKECFREFVYMPFEMMEIPVQLGCDAILRKKYGNYLISKHSGGAHEYPFYQRQIAEYEENHEPMYVAYHFSSEDLDRHHKGEIPSLKEIVHNMLQLFKEAHAQMRSAAIAENYAVLITLTEDCQDGAIAIGTKIEEVLGAGHPIVKLLEEYCEILFTIHESVETHHNIKAEETDAELAEIYTRMDAGIQKYLFERREVVFLPFRGSEWKGFDSIYRAVIQDEMTDVYVVPIPYYERDYYGNFTTMHYDPEEYPSDIRLWNYREFDFGLHHPDMIFIQNPYDEFNYATSVPEFFYAKNIKEYTDKLVYVPYFITDEIEPSDERAVKTLENFCMMPGVVQSDLVIVQSEEMKETYVRALTEFAGKETEPIWREKISGIGSPINDIRIKKPSPEDCPAQWRKVLFPENGDKKKAILYVTGMHDLFNHGEKFIEKIESSLQLLHEQERIAIIWRPYSVVSPVLQRIYPALWGKYQSLINRYEKEGWGILDTCEDAEAAIALSDAYYGEYSPIIRRFQALNLPVMVHNVDV